MNQKDILQAVQWKDLTKLSTREMLIENNITVPWLLASWVLAYYEYYLLALPFSAFFFLAALRQVHNGFHNSLGTNRFLTWLSLYLNSIGMVASAHAVKFHHLRHHKYCMGEEDHEAKPAQMKWYQAILYGPVHFYRIHILAYQLGNQRYRNTIMLESISIVVFVALVFYLQIHFLMYHVAAMIIGEMLTAFFAIWTVHHDTHHDLPRTQRQGWKNRITLSMFYHLEHHLFPAVPTIKLPELARRMDAAIPELPKKYTF